MSSRFLLSLLVLLPLLGGATCQTKPNLPPATTAEHVQTEKRVFVPIEGRLTEHPDAVPEGPVSQAIEVARDRRTLLIACWGQLDAIKAIEGAPSEPRP